YARERNLSFREDESNLCLNFQRNRIRHELLPLLKRNYQPSLDKVIPRLMGLIGAEAEAVGELAANWLKVRSPAFRRSGANSRGFAQFHSEPPKGGTPNFDQLPLAVQRRCVQLQLIAQGVPPEFELVEQLRLKPENAVSLRGGTESTVM